MVVLCGSGDGVEVVGVHMRRCGGGGDQTEKKSVSSGNAGRPGVYGRPVFSRPEAVGRPVPGRNSGTRRTARVRDGEDEIRRIRVISWMEKVETKGKS